MKLGPPFNRESAESLAVQALTFLAGEPARLGGFLAATGIGPAEIRQAASEPGFLAGVLEYLASDDRLIASFAAETGLDPVDVARAHEALGGEPWEREVP